MPPAVRLTLNRTKTALPASVHTHADNCLNRCLGLDHLQLSRLFMSSDGLLSGATQWDPLGKTSTFGSNPPVIDRPSVARLTLGNFANANIPRNSDCNSIRQWAKFYFLGSGRSVVWLARLFRVQEVGSSNLPAPTIFFPLVLCTLGHAETIRGLQAFLSANCRPFKIGMDICVGGTNPL